MAAPKKKVPVKKKATPGKVNATAKKTTAPKKKSKATYKDSEYLSQINALDRALASYKSSMNAQKTRVGTDYGVSTRNLATQKGRDLSDIENDFAARGVVRSGVYGKRVGDYTADYNNQVADVTRARDRTLQDIGTGYRNQTDQDKTLREQARLTAIKRRTAKLKK